MTMMFTEIDVFVGSNTLVDQHVYQLWLDGYSAQEAAKMVKQKEFQLLKDVHQDLIISSILDEFRTFQLMEKLIQWPVHLSEQWTFQLGPQTQKMLIDRYYGFNDTVIREFLGKKLSGRNRKDLDEVAEKTGVPVKSCRRQFDCVKRVYKVVEDMTGSVVANIATNFLLDNELAKKYATVVFLSHNRFEASKKKLSCMSFSDFLDVANQMMEHWTMRDCNSAISQDNQLDVDREFLSELKELKVMTQEKEALEEHKALVLRALKESHKPEKTIQDFDYIFKTVSRNIMQIGHGLNHGKEMRDFFIDVYEKIVEPLKSMKISKSDVSCFLDHYKQIPHSISVLKSDPKLVIVWDRFMAVLCCCILRMLH